MTELKSHENDIAKFDLVIPDEKFEKAINDVYKRTKNRYRVDGFRKGHVPRKMIENIYGKGVFYDDAINETFPEIYRNAIEELNLDVIAQPKVDFEEIKKGEDLLLHIEVETKPHPVLGDYSQIEVKEVNTEVTEEDIDNELKREQEKNARIKPVEDRAAKNGDKVNIDFTGYLDGEKFDGGESENYDLTLGSHTFIPGFEEQIEGHNISEKFDVNVTFPENYQAEDLAGKDAKFEVKINSIEEKEYPEIDDEFAKDISEFDTILELREDYRKKLEVSKKENAKRIIENDAIDYLVKQSEIKVPDAMVEEQIDREMDNFSQRIQQMGVTVDQYIEITGQNIDKIKEQFRPAAIERVKADLVVDEVAFKENIEVTDEDIEKEIEESAKQNGIKDLEKFSEMFKKNVSKRYIVENIKRKKAIEILANHVKLVKEEPQKSEE